MTVSFWGQLVSVVIDYSFKLCEMSLHVVSVGLLQNVEKKKKKHTHMVPFRIIGCLYEDKQK